MPAQAELAGGPYDGAVLPVAARGTLIYARAVKQRTGVYKVRGFKDEGTEREPYRFLERLGDREVYVYDGHLHIGSGYVICPGCEGHIALSDLTRCTYCGTELVT